MAESGVQPAGADLTYTLKYPGGHRATFGDPGVARGGRGELRRPRGRTCQNLRGREGVNTRYYTVMLYVSLTVRE